MKQEAGNTCTLLVFGTLKCTRGIYSMQLLEKDNHSCNSECWEGLRWGSELRTLEVHAPLCFGYMNVHTGHQRNAGVREDEHICNNQG